MKKLFFTTLLSVLLIQFSFAASKTFTVEYQGPGGHSNGAYGNVNAIHAAAQTLVFLADSKASFVVSNFTGGNSVNSIASNAKFSVTVNGTDKEIAAFRTELDKAVEKGVKAENDFRNLKTGATNSSGGRIDIRATVK